MELKDRLKELRNRRSLSASALGEKLGKAESTVRMWETGKANPDIDTLKKLSELFYCSTDYLLGLTDVKTEDITVQGIAQYTGLSEKAIFVLKFFNSISNSTEITRTINLLIEQEDFPVYTSKDENSEINESYGLDGKKWVESNLVHIIYSLTNYFFLTNTNKLWLNETQQESNEIEWKLLKAFGSFQKLLSEKQIVDNLFFLETQDRIRELKKRIDKQFEEGE